MTALKQLLDQRRLEEPQTCSATPETAASLTVITSADERWIFFWHHLATAHLTRVGDRDQLRLTFSTHEVTIGGFHLVALAELISSLHLAVVRPAPTKYAKAADGEPFVDSLRVAPREVAP